MKNFILSSAAFFAFAVLGTNTLSAQATATSNAAKTTVNIKLQDVISIDAGSVAAGGVVDFNYTNTTDYNSDKSVTVDNSLLVTSSKPFDVKVKADGADFIGPNSNKIPVDVLKIKTAAGGTMTGTPKEVTLSTEDQVLMSAAALGAKRSLNIDYTIPAEKAQTVLLGKAQGTYTQKVTYTATAN